MEVVARHTDEVAPPLRARFWSGTIAEAYFPLDLTFRDAARFSGRIERRAMGPVSLSRLMTEPAQYERLPSHIRAGAEEEFLITIPRLSPVAFRQLGREVVCDPGGFLIERGDAPYRFSYGATNELCVLKISKRGLSEKLRGPDRFCARVFDGRDGVAGLFTQTVRALQMLPRADEYAAEVLGRQVVELLALALDGQSEAVEGATSAVRAAHLRRAEQVIRARLSDPDLTPETVAQACAISKRYLHELFGETNATVAQFIRESRLIAARDALRTTPGASIADIAYRFGFSDQAQFSRLFRAMFGLTPSACRRGED
ncbi:helix-turn-helix domain-containing protein [Sinirhodobacter ferrireducens]|uniref:Helix-turn-helix domain-containing protein n=1 Tax=Paenirhodobacter ferrireducens TaxID=1215032 RepID=A0A443L6E6_9RHOB|nr:helix-turn-helix domain-containing protein [Sinirhodobacter ferrireducens]RWR44750.1 helix-turn-helix domain-containing protein [Sinirhodobacter ferrireducens]